MAAIAIELRAEMEDGTVHNVVADQRDVARWEIQDFGTPFSLIDSRIHMAMRWLAWCALRRRGETKLPWEKFDAQCVEAESLAVDDEEADGPGAPADGVDPGPAARRGGTSSGSRRRPGSR